MLLFERCDLEKGFWIPFLLLRTFRDKTIFGNKINKINSAKHNTYHVACRARSLYAAASPNGSLSLPVKPGSAPYTSERRKQGTQHAKFNETVAVDSSTTIIDPVRGDMRPTKLAQTTQTDYQKFERNTPPCNLKLAHLHNNSLSVITKGRTHTVERKIPWIVLYI